MGKVLLKVKRLSVRFVKVVPRKRTIDVQKQSQNCAKTHHVVEIFYKVTTNNAMAICAP